MPTTVRDILSTKGNKVDHIGPDATVRDALQRMAELNIGALVVMEGDRLAGIISERDYARKIVLKGRTSLDTSVRDIMSSRVICARLDQTAEECLAIMTAKAIRHLPVLEQKKVVGVISIGDLVKAIIANQSFVIEQLASYIHG
jgi:CBS domain-containing protein